MNCMEPKWECLQKIIRQNARLVKMYLGMRVIGTNEYIPCQSLGPQQKESFKKTEKWRRFKGEKLAPAFSGPWGNQPTLTPGR